MTFNLSANWEKVSKEQFREFFLSSMKGLENSLTKLELRQSYQEPGDPSYEAFLKNDFETAQVELRKRVSSQHELYKDLGRKNISFSRIRYAETPFSDYLQYELLSYPVSASFGERILFVTQNDVDQTIKDSKYFRDCLIFDERAVLINGYTENGQPDGGYVTVSTFDIENFLQTAESLRKKSTPLGEILHLDG